MKKKLAALLLSLALCLSLCTVMAFADGDPVAQVDDVDYYSLEDAIASATDGGTVLVLKNCELSARTVIEKNLTIQAGVSGVTVTLNGALLIGNGSTGVKVTLGGNGNDLTFTPNKDSGEKNTFRPIAIRSGSELVLDDGVTLTGSDLVAEAAKNYGGMIYVQNKDNTPATLTMKSGSKISNSSANYGGAVYVDGKFMMAGGTIENGKANYVAGTTPDYTGRGGAVFVSQNGTFTMTGGTIWSCQADWAGGGVYSYGPVSISGSAKIDGCRASGITGETTKGGAVYMLRGKMTMGGGTITNDNSADLGDGVYLAPYAELRMDNGTMYNLYIHYKDGEAATASVNDVLTVFPGNAAHTYDGGYNVYTAAKDADIALDLIKPHTAHHNSTDTTEQSVTSAVTGDVGVVFYAVLALTGGAGALAHTKRKKA